MPVQSRCLPTKALPNPVVGQSGLNIHLEAAWSARRDRPARLPVAMLFEPGGEIPASLEVFQSVAVLAPSVRR